MLTEEKKVAIFDPLKMDGRADGNQKKAFPNYQMKTVLLLQKYYLAARNC